MPCTKERESEALVSGSEEDLQRVQTVRPWRRRWAMAVAVLVVGMAAVAALRITTAPLPCPEGSEAEGAGDDSLVSLAAQVNTEDVISAVEDGDHDAVRQWLATQSEISEAAQEVGSSPQAKEELLKQAFAAKTPEEAKKMVATIKRRAVSRWQAKRQDLKRYLKAHRLGLRRKKPQTAAKPPAKQNSEIASCVFSVLQATSAVASLAANINDATMNCGGTPPPTANLTKGKICLINLSSVFWSITFLATQLSLAAQECAATIQVPPEKTGQQLCSAGISGTLVSIAQLSGASGLLAVACEKGAKAAHLPPGALASNIGDAQPLNATRRLSLGGGVGSVQTRCAVDVTSAAWFLAEAGLNINSAAHEGIATCNIEGDEAQKTTQQRMCTFNVAYAIFAFSEMAKFLQLALVHCSDQLNVAALCGAGVAGTISSIACATTSLAAAVQGCDTAQGTDNGNANPFRFGPGRKLSITEVEASADSLKARFTTPAEAWKSIGFDLSDKTASWRGLIHTSRPPAEEIASLVEKPAAKTSGLFQQSCS